MTSSYIIKSNANTQRLQLGHHLTRKLHVLQRMAFLASLAFAVWLDPERLFFLLIILPVIVAFYAIFGLMGGWVGRRTASPLAQGLGTGLILAWAIAVTFPLFTTN